MMRLNVEVLLVNDYNQITSILHDIENNLPDGKVIVKANDLRREYEIARKQGCLVVPVGATGYAARKLWEEANKDFEAYYETALSGMICL